MKTLVIMLVLLASLGGTLWSLAQSVKADKKGIPENSPERDMSMNIGLICFVVGILTSAISIIFR